MHGGMAGDPWPPTLPCAKEAEVGQQSHGERRAWSIWRWAAEAAQEAMEEHGKRGPVGLLLPSLDSHQNRPMVVAAISPAMREVNSLPLPLADPSELVLLCSPCYSLPLADRQLTIDRST